MTSKGHSAIFAATAVLLVAAGGNALAQVPDWAVGTWKGKMRGAGLEAIPTSGVARVLTIEKGGKCWLYLEGGQPAPATCTFSGESMTAISAAGNKFELKLKNGELDGSIAGQDGNKRAFLLSKQ